MNLFRKKSKRELIERHYEKYVGKIHLVFHEIISPDFHLDVYWIKTKLHGQKVNVLATIGMSEIPMNTTAKLDLFKFAELCIVLPEDWKLGMDDFKNENNYWPVRLLKDIARFPHENNTWIGMEHTIGNQNGKTYSAGIGFNSTLVFLLMGVNPKFYSFKYKRTPINFYCLTPLYPEELDLKLESGIDLLFERLEQRNIGEIVDINRENVGFKLK